MSKELQWTVYSCPEHGAVSDRLAEYDSKTDTYRCGHNWRKGVNGYCKLTLTVYVVKTERPSATRLDSDTRYAEDDPLSPRYDE